MESWSVRELEKWLKEFNNPNNSFGYFTNTEADSETIKKAQELLKQKKKGNNNAR